MYPLCTGICGIYVHHNNIYLIFKNSICKFESHKLIQINTVNFCNIFILIFNNNEEEI